MYNSVDRNRFTSNIYHQSNWTVLQNYVWEIFLSRQFTTWYFPVVFYFFLNLYDTVLRSGWIMSSIPLSPKSGFQTVRLLFSLEKARYYTILDHRSSLIHVTEIFSERVCVCVCVCVCGLRGGEDNTDI